MLQMKKRKFSGSTDTKVSPREQRNRELARILAEEGIVLLENDGILPLKKEKKIGLFGSGAVCTIKGGTGSGDVNAREVVSVYQGMTKEGFQITSEAWLNDYEERYKKARQKWRSLILEKTEKAGTSHFFDVYVAHPFQMPEGRKIVREDLEGTKTAVYVISRNAGEGDDRLAQPGDYYLSFLEKAELQVLSDLCENLIILINSGAQIDLEELLKVKKIRAVMNISQPGMEGGTAAAGVLAGRICPSGKLTDTWAVKYQDFPNADEFSYRNGNTAEEIYSEGIYVGYRYFDVAQIKPRYAFGYGLSYTEFKISAEKAEICGMDTIISVKVKNTGSCFTGKEVVQVYLSCPQKAPKEVKKLVAFAKTKLLAPGEEELLTMTFDQKSYAYFCEEEHCWKIEAGDYILLIGNSSDNLAAVNVVTVEHTTVIEKVHPICQVERKFEEWKPNQEAALKKREQWETSAEKKSNKLILIPQEEQKKAYISSFTQEAENVVKNLSEQQLIWMSLGEISKGHEVALGAAGIMVPGAAGETSGCLEKEYQIPGVSMADGPAGLRIMKEYKADIEAGNVYTNGILGSMENGFFLKEEKKEFQNETIFYQFCTAFPVGTMIAQTWNEELQRMFGRAVGEELQEMGISWWLAPGMNIHRNPLCGRNFEYYSEDPYVSGKTAAAVTRGVQSVPGTGTTIKHFVCNNAEQNRMGSNSILSERTLREIYLRGFEIAIKTAQPMAVMSSYNLVNGTHTSENHDLLTKVLRKEWGFAGIVMTDWTTTSAGGSTPWKVLAGGGNLIMPGAESDISDLEDALRTGKLKREELESRIQKLLEIIYQTNAYEGCKSYNEQFEQG